MKVRIHRNQFTDNYEFFFTERDGNVRYIYRPTHDDLWVKDPVIEGGITRPTFTFSSEVGREALESLAAELAQHGYAKFDASPAVEAQKRHIEDLQIGAARLFALAEKAMA